MTPPVHHLDDEVLSAYATGATTEPVALVVACHLTLCPVCRDRTAAAEAVGGALLEQPYQAPLADDLMERVLARLDEVGPATTTSAAPSLAATTVQPFTYAGIPLPRPLARYLERERPPQDLRRAFRFLAPGVRGVDLPVVAAPTVRTRLLRLAPGVKIPRHAHAAPEFTVVFSGGLSDGGAHYGRGDVRFRDTDTAHLQVVDPDQPCIALVINEGALVAQTWGGKLAAFLFDR